MVTAASASARVGQREADAFQARTEASFQFLQFRRNSHMSSPCSEPSWTWCARPWAVFGVLCKKLNCGLAICRERRDPSRESLLESIARPPVLCALIGRGSKHSLVNFDQCSKPRSLILTIENALPGQTGAKSHQAFHNVKGDLQGEIRRNRARRTKSKAICRRRRAPSRTTSARSPTTSI